jgi:hypothetical protein
MVMKKNGKAEWKSAAARRLVTFANTASVEAAIEKIATDLLAGLTLPPTDLNTLMGRLDVVRCEAEESFWGSGELRQANDGLEIVYSSHLSPPRRRFTIAHELGHAVLARTGPRFPRSGREVERICDMFATEVLLPRAPFIEHASGAPHVEKVFELARLFKTSIAATARRYADLKQVSLFEIEDGKFVRSNGRINPQRSLIMDGSARIAIDQASRGQAGESLVLLRRDNFVREVLLQWKPFATPGRALFLFSSPPSPESLGPTGVTV